MRVDLTIEEISELAVALRVAGESSESGRVNWELICKVLAKLDRSLYHSPISENEPGSAQDNFGYPTLKDLLEEND